MHLPLSVNQFGDWILYIKNSQTKMRYSKQKSVEALKQEKLFQQKNVTIIDSGEGQLEDKSFQQKIQWIQREFHDC